MKVALIKPPLLGHQHRGTGIYAKELSKAFDKTRKVQLIHCTYADMPHDVDIAHFPYFDPFFLTLPISKIKKTVVTIHDLIPLRFPTQFPRGIKGEIKWQIQKYLVQKSDAIITDSQASSDDIKKYLSVDPHNVHVIYLAAGIDFFRKVSESEKKQLRQKYALPEKFALFVGEATWNKNIPDVLQAITQIDVPLVMVSKSFVQGNPDRFHASNKDWLVAAHEKAQELKWFKSLQVPIEELTALYQSATVLVQPSWYEGFGLPILEAMASGCPVITTHEGSLAEVAGNAALIVEPNHPNQIAQAVKKIFSDRKLKSSLMIKGKNQARKFSWEKTAQQTYAIYEAVAKQKN